MAEEIQKVCLVCMDRTGSNMLSSRLNTHQSIRFYNEVFHRQYVIFADDRMNGSNEMIARRDTAPAAFISQMWNGGFEPEATRDQIRSIGFKLFLNHNADALRYVINSDCKLIFLRRRNALSRFSSFKIAAASGAWKVKKSDVEANKGVPKKTLVNFNATEFRAYMQNYLSLEMMFEMLLNRWNRNCFNIWYEDLVTQPRVWDDLVVSLGYKPTEFGETSLIKQNNRDILARFSNPQDVSDYVASINRYEWLTE
jgi:LPS sulfotransferase NodH